MISAPLDFIIRAMSVVRERERERERERKRERERE
jgi:hypothetical protein